MLYQGLKDIIEHFVTSIYVERMHQSIVIPTTTFYKYLTFNLLLLPVILLLCTSQ